MALAPGRRHLAGGYALFSTGIVLWLAYGLLADDLPILMNVVALAASGLVRAVRYRRR